MAEETTPPNVPDLLLELVPIPVSDVDRAREFYERIGFGNVRAARVTDTRRVVRRFVPREAHDDAKGCITALWRPENQG